MFDFLSIGGYYSSPTNSLGEEGTFSSVIKGMASFIVSNWIFSLIILLIILIFIYLIYRRLKKNKENLAPDSSNSVPDAF